MTWAAPPLFVAGNALTAAQLNVLSSDLNETAPAKASAVGQFFAAVGINSIAARLPVNGSVLTAETTASVTFADLATVGPQCSVTLTTSALVLMNATVQNNTIGSASSIGVDISGATVQGPVQIYISLVPATANQQATMGGMQMFTGLTAGVNTFKMMYVVGGGTGTFNRRYMTVLPF